MQVWELMKKKDFFIFLSFFDDQTLNVVQNRFLVLLENYLQVFHIIFSAILFLIVIILSSMNVGYICTSEKK